MLNVQPLHGMQAGHSSARTMQAATIVGTLLGRFTVEFADRMDGYDGVLERQTIAFTLAVDEGLTLRFVPRGGWVG